MAFKDSHVGDDGIEELIRQDTQIFVAEITDIDDEPVDLTGGTLRFSLNTSSAPADDTGAAFTPKVITSFTAPLSGIQEIELTSSNMNIAPGVYWYDLQFKNSAGQVVSRAKEKVRVVSDISRTA